MRKGLAWILAVVMLVTTISFSGITGVFAADENLLAFPGAEGGGKYAKGARNGTPTVYHVTNLNKSGSGSFADAISKSNRIIVFDVGGTIHVDKGLSIKKNTTILGQTAPGDGITIAGGNIEIGGDHVILRYLRVRPSDINGGEPDGIGGRWVDNVIVDHCSVSWSIDEGLTLYGGSIEGGRQESTNITMQYCIGSESLRMSNHFKGAHGYGGIWGGDLASYHHNLLAHHDSRVPRLDRNLIATEVVNNVIYDWGLTNTGYGAEGHSYNAKISLPSNVNWENNYHKYGPGTDANKRTRIFQISSTVDVSTGQTTYDKDKMSNFYFAGNTVFGSSAITNNNALGVASSNNGNMLDSPISMTRNGIDYSVERETAEEAYENVLKNAGATLPKRDSIDARIIDDVRNGTGRILNKPIEVGGFIKTETTKRTFEIPQEWKDANGMGSAGEADIVPSGKWKGYTWIEAYVNEWTAQQSTPTNPHITVESPSIMSTDNVSENWTVIKDNEPLVYSAKITPESGTDITKVDIIIDEEVVKSYPKSKLAEIDGGYQLTADDIALTAGTHFVLSRAYNDKGESTASPTSIVYVNSSSDSGKYSHIQLGTVPYNNKGASSINNDGIFTIGGSGKIANSAVDNCDFMYRAVEGDFEYVARIIDIPKFENGVLAGMMVRENLDTNARMAMLADGWLKYGENVRIAYRTKTGGSAATGFMKNSSGSEISNSDGYESTKYPLPEYMKISRKGDTLTLAVSNSGSNWTDNSRKPYTITMSDLADTLYIGFAVDSAKGTSTRDYYTMAQFDMVTLNGESEFDYSQKYNKLPLVEEEYLIPIPWKVSEGVSDKDMSNSAYPSSGAQKNNRGHSLYMSGEGQMAEREFDKTNSGIVEVSYDLLTTGNSESDSVKVAVRDNDADKSVVELIARQDASLELADTEGAVSGREIGDGLVNNTWYNFKLYFDFDARNSGAEEWITVSMAQYENYANKQLSKDKVVAVKTAGLDNSCAIDSVEISNMDGGAKYLTGFSVKMVTEDELPIILPPELLGSVSDEVISEDTTWSFTKDLPFSKFIAENTEIDVHRTVNVNGLTLYADPEFDIESQKTDSGNEGMLKLTNSNKLSDALSGSVDMCIGEGYGSIFGGMLDKNGNILDKAEQKLTDPKSKVIGFKVDKPMQVEVVTKDGSAVPVISTADGAVLEQSKTANPDGTVTVSAGYFKLEDTDIYISFENGSSPVYEISVKMLELSGSCGDNLTWAFDEFGELTISGSGAMNDYAENTAPWSVYESSIKAVNVSDTTTSIGDYAFANCTQLKTITIPSSVTSIGENAFKNSNSGLVIYGSAGSTAESYAAAKGITFETLAGKAYTVASADGIENGNVRIEASSANTVWTATGNTAANEELWPEIADMGGSLVTLMDLNASNTTATINGIKFTKYITTGSNGSFNDGRISGNAFKFISPVNGKLSVYIARLPNNKEFMICEEGTGSKESALHYQKNTTGSDINNLYATIDVEAGKTYYAGVLGSKGRYLGVSLEGNVYMEAVEKNVGDTVNFRVTAKDGYELDKINAVDSFGNAVELTLDLSKTNGTFTMPASNVIISTEFKEAENIPIETGRCDMAIKSKTVNGDGAVIALEVANGTAEKLSGTVIVCVKNSKGGIKSITTNSLTAENNKATLADIEVKDYDEGEDVIEIYFWNSMSTISPICRVVKE